MLKIPLDNEIGWKFLAREAPSIYSGSLNISTLFFDSIVFLLFSSTFIKLFLERSLNSVKNRRVLIQFFLIIFL